MTEYVYGSNPADRRSTGPIILRPDELEVTAFEVQRTSDGAAIASIKEGVKGPSQWYTFQYSFAVQGGAVGAITLTDVNGDALVLPDNAVILRCLTECVTAATSGGAATIALGITGNTDAFEGATAYTDNSYDTINTIDSKASELPLKVDNSAGVSVLATVADAALTAGVFRAHIEFLHGA